MCLLTHGKVVGTWEASTCSQIIKATLESVSSSGKTRQKNHKSQSVSLRMLPLVVVFQETPATVVGQSGDPGKQVYLGCSLDP